MLLFLSKRIKTIKKPLKFDIIELITKKNNKYEKGLMKIEQFEKMTTDELKKYGELIQEGSTYDDNGKEISYKHDSGKWEKRIINEEGKVIFSINSDGYWRKTDYGNTGNRTFRDSVGNWSKTIYNEGKMISYGNNYGFYRIKGEIVSKEEYEAFMKEYEREQ